MTTEHPYAMVESCWPGLLPLLEALRAASEDEAAAIWDDIEGWAARNGYPSPRAWAAMVDRAATTTGPNAGGGPR